MTVFIVQLRKVAERMWDNQAEVVAGTAQEAAESLAGLALSTHGDRASLRARVWPTPFGTGPHTAFYMPMTESEVDGARPSG